jgi:hypothetical protein
MGCSAIEQDEQMAVLCAICAANERVMKKWGKVRQMDRNSGTSL